MTAHKDQIQALIAEIDRVLLKPSPRLSWATTEDVERQRQVVERVRSYLGTLHQRIALETHEEKVGIEENLSLLDEASTFASAPQAHAKIHPPDEASQQQAAREIFQAIESEVDSLRINLIQSLHTDLEALYQRRDSLVEEIKQLEVKYQKYSESQKPTNQQQIIDNFLQGLMEQLQESLGEQLARSLSSFETQLLNAEADSNPIVGELSSPLLHPKERLEQLRMLQNQSDRLLMNLDANAGVMFETLQRNIQGYQDSLARGLEKMHNLGQQGEVMFTALVNHLAQQLGIEASSYVQASLNFPEIASSTGADAAPAAMGSPLPNQLSFGKSISKFEAAERADGQSLPSPPKEALDPGQSTEDNLASLDLPYPGTELTPPPSELGEQTVPLQRLSDLKEDREQSGLNLEDLALADLNDLEADLAGDFEMETLPDLDIDDLFLQSLHPSTIASGQKEAGMEAVLQLPEMAISDGDGDMETHLPLNSSDEMETILQLPEVEISEPEADDQMETILQLPEVEISEPEADDQMETILQLPEVEISELEADDGMQTILQLDTDDEMATILQLPEVIGTPIPAADEVPTMLQLPEVEISELEADDDGMQTILQLDTDDEMATILQLPEVIGTPIPAADEMPTMLQLPEVQVSELEADDGMQTILQLDTDDEMATILQLPDVVEAVTPAADEMATILQLPEVQVSELEADDGMQTILQGVNDGEDSVEDAEIETESSELGGMEVLDESTIEISGIHEEIDDFYEVLFGDDSQASLISDEVIEDKEEPSELFYLDDSLAERSSVMDDALRQTDVSHGPEDIDEIVEPSIDESLASVNSYEISQQSEISSDLDVRLQGLSDDRQTTTEPVADLYAPLVEETLFSSELEEPVSQQDDLLFQPGSPAESVAQTLEDFLFAEVAEAPVLEVADPVGEDLVWSDDDVGEAISSETMLYSLPEENLIGEKRDEDELLLMEETLSSTLAENEVLQDLPISEVNEQVLQDLPISEVDETNAEIVLTLTDLLDEPELVETESEDRSQPLPLPEVAPSRPVQVQNLESSEDVAVPTELSEGDLEGVAVSTELSEGELEVHPEDTNILEEALTLPEESYISASPEENLLATDEDLMQKPDVKLRLNKNTLRQLHEDLYSLEGLEDMDFQDQEDFGNLDLLVSGERTEELSQVEAAADPFRLEREGEEFKVDDSEAAIASSETADESDVSLPVDNELSELHESVFVMEDLEVDRSLTDEIDALSGVVAEQDSDFSELEALISDSEPDEKKKELTIQAQHQASEIVLPEFESLANDSGLEESEEAEQIIQLGGDLVSADIDIARSDTLHNFRELPGSLPSTRAPRLPIDFLEDREYWDWYLGVDLGTTGMSAVLLNRSTGKLYPIYWVVGQSINALVDRSTSARSFRLPAVAFLSQNWSSQHQLLETSVVVGPLAFALSGGNAAARTTIASASDDGGDREAADGEVADAAATQNRLERLETQELEEKTAGVVLQGLKLNLKVCLPFRTTGQPTDLNSMGGWEPVLERSQRPVYWDRQAVQTLLSTLRSEEAGDRIPDSALMCGASGLDSEAFNAALTQLGGVILNCPIDCAETYSFNLREAVLGAGLVRRPEQVFFVEDAIATLLADLQRSGGQLDSESVQADPRFPQRGDDDALEEKQQDRSESQIAHQSFYRLPAERQGGTLAINSGASITELALVELPANLHDLVASDFHLRSFPYAGNGIDQDIICQLLCPQWTRRQRPLDTTASLLPQFLSSRWTLDDLPSADDPVWSSLGLEELDLPFPGEPDLAIRDRLQHRLERSALGQMLLESARALKLILQQQDSFTLELGSQQWVLLRRELESQIFVPFIQQLNRQLNALLTEQGMPVQAISQVICTGGTASLPAIARWLRQKLPNATIVQDFYQQSSVPACSRVAYGLATLPLCPQVLDLPRQQYSDYFLLLELLRVLPDQATPDREIMQLLERRGINTSSCQPRILALLAGELPAGLVPPETYASLMTEASRQNPIFQELTAAPLFYAEAEGVYRPNPEQCDRLLQHLSTVLTETYQTFQEPYIVSLGFPVS